MPKKLLHIALLFTLIVSVVSASNCKAFCSSLRNLKETSCCKLQEEGSCCQEISGKLKVNPDISVVNASVEMPDIVAYFTSFFYPDFSYAVLDYKHRNVSYIPPLLDPDLSVLYRVFII